MTDNKITIAFSPNSQTQILQTLDLAELADLPTPITAKVLITHLNWDKQYPEIFDCEIGIFSQKITWDEAITAGDRLEIYRPLTVTPMRKRQLLMAQRQKSLNKQRAKSNIAKKLIDKKAYYNALRAEQGE